MPNDRVRRTRAHRRISTKPPPWLVVGAVVDYCSVIGQPPSALNMVVREGPQLICGTWCVWLVGKAGAVSCEACLQAQGASFQNEGFNAD